MGPWVEGCLRLGRPKLQTYIYIYIYIYLFIYTCVYTYIHVYIHMYIYVCMLYYIYIYIYTMYVYTRIRIYTYLERCILYTYDVHCWKDSEYRNGDSGLNMEVAEWRIFFRIAPPCYYQLQALNRSYAAIRIMLDLVAYQNGLELTQHITQSLRHVVQLLDSAAAGSGQLVLRCRSDDSRGTWSGAIVVVRPYTP